MRLSLRFFITFFYVFTFLTRLVAFQVQVLAIVVCEHCIQMVYFAVHEKVLMKVRCCNNNRLDLEI